MMGGYFWETVLHAAFETLPGAPARSLVGNAQAMSPLSGMPTRLKWLCYLRLRDGVAPDFRLENRVEALIRERDA